MPGIIHSTPRNAYPGDQVRIMVGAYTDRQGNEWPKGTEYTPLSFGVDNTIRGAPNKQTVTIGGRRVEFIGRRNANVQRRR